MINTPENDTRAPMSAQEALARAIDTLQDWGDGVHEADTVAALTRLLRALRQSRRQLGAGLAPGLGSALEDPNA